MIPREIKRHLFILLIPLLFNEAKPQEGRQYDTSEWIPVTGPPPGPKNAAPDQRSSANARVLSLDAPAQQFLPEYFHVNQNPYHLPQFMLKTEPERIKPKKPGFKFPAPPVRNQPKINYYNEPKLAPYLFEQRPQIQPNYYPSPQQPIQQNPSRDRYVATPSINPQVPAVDAESIYEKYNIPFNASFYRSLNPSSINNELYPIDTNNKQNVLQNLRDPIQPPKPNEQTESVQLTQNNLRDPVKQNEQTYSGQLTQNNPRDPAQQNEQTYSGLLAQNNLRNPVQQNEQTYSGQLTQNNLRDPLQPNEQTYSGLLAQNNLRDPVQPNEQTDNVQLVYVPVENLKNTQDVRQSYRQNQAPKSEEENINPDRPKFEKLVRNPDPTPRYNPALSFGSSDDKQTRLENIQQDFVRQAQQAHKLQEQIDQINPLNEQPTTPKPKRKPNQPPLAVFMESDNKAEVTDVLNVLKNAKTIAVQDTVTKNSPKIFIGPSNLDSPEGYTKFPLPYLNNINGNRIERKIDQLPFFVAPVSYKAPPGYAKISLPSPHVGSVVISVPQVYSTPHTPLEVDPDQINPYRFNPDFSIPSKPTHDAFEYNSQTEAPIYENPYRQQSYRNPTPELDLHQQPVQPVRYEQTTLPSGEEFYASTPKSQDNLSPDINPLELAINDYELRQINSHLAEPEKKVVKHSSTRRPPQNDEEISFNRGHSTYESKPATPSRGRIRGRGRGTSRTTTTTTTTEKYTVLEEFDFRQPTGEYATEDYRKSLTQSENKVPETVTTPFTASRYLPEEKEILSRPQENLETKYSQGEENTQFVQEAPTRTSPQQQEVTITPNYQQIENIQAHTFNREYPETLEVTQKPLQNFYTEKAIDAQEQNANVNQQQITPTHLHRFSPEITSYENREPIQHRRPYDQPQYPEQPIYQQVLENKEELKPSHPNVFPPDSSFDQTYISLQDQAVRSLLAPNILPASKTTPSRPTPIYQSSTIEEEQIVTSPQPPSTEKTTTTTARSRTRGRGRARLTTPAVSTTRRTVSRRRPITRASTERIASSTEYSSNVKQRFRTKSRPVQQEISERISTTENDVSYKQPPQSYMQFEHSIDEQQIITVNPNENSNYDVYKVNGYSPNLEYENTNSRPTPVVDVQVTHQVPEENIRNQPDIITTPNEDEKYVRYDTNIRSGGVLNNNQNEEKAKAPVRGRTRTRSRLSTTTSRPVTRISTRTPIKITTTNKLESEEEESYGFIRQPNYDSHDEAAIHFVGEIRPKYSPRTTTTEEVVTRETPKPRIRSRTRAPTKKPTYSSRRGEETNSKRTEEITRRSSTVRTRGRGASHYRAPEYVKRDNDDEDVANQNYPINFLQKIESNSQITASPLKGNEFDDQQPYQSINRPKYVSKPNGWSNLNDIPSEDKDISDTTREPEALPLTDTTEQSEELITEVEDFMSSLEKTKTSPTPEPLESTPGQKSRRKGVWKLVKQRVIDPLEVAESQNSHSVLNSFDSNEKKNIQNSYSKYTGNFQDDTDETYQEKNIDSFETETRTYAAPETTSPEIFTTTLSTPKVQENIFDTIYEMFGIFNKAEQEKNTTTETTSHFPSQTETIDLPTTTLEPPNFPDEITEKNIDTTLSTKLTTKEQSEGTTESDLITTLQTDLTNKKQEVEPWEMKAVKTSTSTKVSHETEICYKGRCVKSKNKRKLS